MRFDTLLTVLRQTEGAASALNTPAETFEPAGRVYAHYAPGQGREGEDAGQEMSVTGAVFTARRNALTRSLTSRDRIESRGETWVIINVADHPENPRAWRLIQAQRRTDV
ncbi:phage head completion protein [Ponticoccus alexandrii]|uniref:Head-tail adaptor protein n=1 Tax=Ponticoccus alexandrii TaxID=1943633 RepID=A0ABX7F780_9RHOB|nr:head-tail adaptor protein [Ponticoccus alexandrii]ETA53980.2 hypothetical protein P279_00340 [Rhodobacteraceae bacterium PD-2]QRF66378.1 head-tail adaptor protein [Ponticoccus alexandrii]